MEMWYKIFWILVLFCWSILLGWTLHKRYLLGNRADGVCIRTSDGEVFLKLSESAQIKLSDKKTKALLLFVRDVDTRKEQIL